VQGDICAVEVGKVDVGRVRVGGGGEGRKQPLVQSPSDIHRFS